TRQQLKAGLDGSGPPLRSFILIDPGLIPSILACIVFWVDLPSTISTPKVLASVGGDNQDLLDSITNSQIRAECKAYASLKVLLPPYADWEGPGPLEAAYDQVEFGTSKPLNGVRRYIEKNWKPNPTLFDEPNYILHRDGHYPGYFGMLSSPNRFVTRALATLFTRLNAQGRMPSQGTDPRWPSYTVFRDTLFLPVTRALRSSHSKVKFEFINSDVFQFLALLKASSSFLDWRGESPTSFTRAYMSNVPDYAGGILEMTLYAVPCLQPIDISSVGMNCIFNGPAWGNNFEDFVYTYTLLQPDQLPQYLGCKIRWYRNVESVLQPPFCLLPCTLPLKPSQLASRENFEGWLQRVFMRILAPPDTSMMMDYIILMPTTFRTFLQLLVRAMEIGYPSVWISDFLGRILSDTLHSSWRPYRTTPIPAHTINTQYPSTKLQLSPWMVDIEIVVASGLPILPQDMASSLTCLNMTETAVFQTTLSNVSSKMSYDRCPDLALVFCAPGFRLDQKPLNTYDLLISETAAGNKVQIIYSILTWDLNVDTKLGNVSWRMSMARSERMKEEGWVLYLWQTNAPDVASKSSKASEWKRL
ncbi:hypothetical protein DFH06DRAFT_556320, partial [Mycena polygramma]